MKIIDAHQHFWKKELFANLKLSPGMDILVNDYSPEDLKPILDQVGVSQTVLVQTYSSLQKRWMAESSSIRLLRALPSLAGRKCLEDSEPM